MPLFSFTIESLVSGPLSADLQIKVYKITIWDIMFKDIKFASCIMGKMLVKIRGEN